ncbi:hypothetical protein R3W88_004423 [Solanum pinnatisectum]|uniref:Polyprotein protein n=1 Tax=Solanum pinnatisectum TaxID=50273 RepID=A0AAV9KBN2_9SOLN|nr:hypothetical protein R3W88_004423 [Solanum pinnatisectum]
MREYGVQIEGHKLALDTLTVTMKECEKGQGATDVVTALKADIVGLRKDMDKLKSIDLSMLFSTVEILDVPSTDISVCSEMPLTTTGDETRANDVVVESEAETDEEQLDVHEETVYDDMADLEGAMVHTVVQASLRDVSMLGSSGSKDTEIPGTDAQTEGAVDMQTLPQS